MATTLQNTNVLRSKVSLQTMIRTRNGDAGPEIVQKLFFGTTSTTSFGGILKRWTGSTWTKTKLLYYNGSSFVKKPLKVFKAGTWQLVDMT